MGSILEMMIVLLGAAVLTLQGIKEDVAHKRIALLQIEGQNQASINAALGDYITNNVGALIPASYSQSSVSSLTPPSLATLSTQSNTKVNYKPGPFWGGTYQISLSVVPANCSAAAGTCHIAALLYPSLPLTLAGKPDVAGAGVVAAAGGAQFGYSTNKAPGTIRGLNGSWNTPNPNGNVVASIVAINGFGNDANSPYYRRDGALPLTGALAGGGQDANNLRNINATGTVAAPAVSASNVAVANAIRSPGTLQIQNAQGTGLAMMNSADTFTNGNANVSGTVIAQAVNFNTSAANCAWNQVTMRGANQMWVCNQWGNWVPISQLVNNVMTIAKYENVADGAGVPKPACTNGTPTYTVVPQTIALNVAANPPWESSIYRLIDMGSYWQTQFWLQDANGAWYSGNTLGLAAEVQIQCSYTNE